MPNQLEGCAAPARHPKADMVFSLAFFRAGHDGAWPSSARGKALPMKNRRVSIMEGRAPSRPKPGNGLRKRRDAEGARLRGLA